MPLKKIVVVGAGPSGLLLSLLLAKEGIQIILLEKGEELNKDPRASHYASPAVYELDRAGVLGDVQQKGFSPKSFSWRTTEMEMIASLDFTVVPDDYPHKMQVLPLHELGPLLYNRLQRLESAEVKFGHKVVQVGQDTQKAWVQVETSSGTDRIEADYVIGCDGASSRVRKELFGNEFEGEELEAQIVATNVWGYGLDETDSPTAFPDVKRYDFRKYGATDANFIIDRKNFFMAAQITKEGLWRVSYGEDHSISKQECIDAQPRRFEEILPGNPKPGEYTLENVSPYRLHQRCARSFRVGRVVLAADAAHLCNPFGGLGLTGGMVDVGNLFDALIGIHKHLAHESILDRYSTERMRIWRNYIDPMSRVNFLRVSAQETEIELDKFAGTCKQAEDDKELALNMVSSMDVLRYDMTQHYTTWQQRWVPRLVFASLNAALFYFTQRCP